MQKNPHGLYLITYPLFYQQTTRKCNNALYPKTLLPSKDVTKLTQYYSSSIETKFQNDVKASWVHTSLKTIFIIFS